LPHNLKKGDRIVFIIGVDVGLSGAVACYDSEAGALLGVADMPVFLLVRGRKEKREIDLASLVDLLSQPGIDHAFVEAVSSMPGQGVSSVFSFGQSLGIVKGILATRKIPMTMVPPNLWKKALAVPKAKAGTRARASQLMPESAGEWPLVKYDGRAEAALIALWGARSLNQRMAA
jgi:crossover junction endodeoxyribonuclease RuvC